MLGDCESITAGSSVSGIGGDLTQRIQGVYSMIAKGRMEQKGKTIWTGSESVNRWAVVNALLGIVQELANTVATHTHNGGSPPDQSGQFKGQANQASSEKNKLSPIVG